MILLISCFIFLVYLDSTTQKEGLGDKENLVFWFGQLDS